MNLIQFNIQGSLSGTTLFDPTAAGVVKTVSDSRIIFNTSPALTFGRFDVASLLNLAGRPMVVFAFSMSNAVGPVIGGFGVVSPPAPGFTARGSDGTFLIGSPGVQQVPIVVPSQYLLQLAADSPPVTLLLLVDQLKSGNIVNEIVRGQLTA